MAFLVEYLPSNYETLNSNPNSIFGFRCLSMMYQGMNHIILILLRIFLAFLNV
jgi:hypothetical protein